MRERRIAAALVAACDTLLEEKTLTWLERTARLKSPAYPAALSPGEAGVVLALETDEAASQRGVAPLATLVDVQTALEERSLLSGQESRGDGLLGLFDALANSGHLRNDQRAWFITDQNGEQYRAMEWGNAVVRARQIREILEKCDVWHPAMSFGDTGAAGPAVAVAAAIRAFARGYAPSPVAIVLSASEGNCRASIALRRAEPQALGAAR